MGTERPYTQLVGGPFDGVECARRSEPFAYYGALGARGVRRYHEPGHNRYLYRLLPDGKYMYAGHQFRRCDGCGAVIATKTCGICLHN